MTLRYLAGIFTMLECLFLCAFYRSLTDDTTTVKFIVHMRTRMFSSLFIRCIYTPIILCWIKLTACLLFFSS